MYFNINHKDMGQNFDKIPNSDLYSTHKVGSYKQTPSNSSDSYQSINSQLSMQLQHPNFAYEQQPLQTSSSRTLSYSYGSGANPYQQITPAQSNSSHSSHLQTFHPQTSHPQQSPMQMHSHTLLALSSSQPLHSTQPSNYTPQSTNSQNFQPVPIHSPVHIALTLSNSQSNSQPQLPLQDLKRLSTLSYSSSSSNYYPYTSQQSVTSNDQQNVQPVYPKLLSQSLYSDPPLIHPKITNHDSFGRKTMHQTYNDNSIYANASYSIHEQNSTKLHKHNAVEQRYRNSINEKFHDLQSLVPALRHFLNKQKVFNQDGIDIERDDENLAELEGLQPIKKISKGIILYKATEYIKFLELKNERLMHEMKEAIGKINEDEIEITEVNSRSEHHNLNPHVKFEN